MAIYQGLEATLHESFWGERGSDLEQNDLLRLFPEFQGKALEIGAGSGRIMRSLYNSGWHIEGIEPSPEMVQMHQKKSPEALLHQTRLEDYSTPVKYDLLLMTSYVFQLFEDPGATLDLLRSLLQEEGKIYLSLFIPWAEIVGEQPEEEWTVDDEIKLSPTQKARHWVKFSIDRVQQKLDREHRYELLEKKKAPQITETSHHLRWYTSPEFLLLIEKYGFQVSQRSYEFGDLYDSNAHSMGFVLSSK